MRKQSFSSGLQLMFTPAALVPFLIGSLALAILGNAGYQLLTNWLGTESLAVVKIALGALLVIVGAAWTISRIVNRLRSVPEINQKRPDKRKGLILLVSNEQTSRKAIAWHHDTLKHCWLLCSAQSAAIAAKLKDELNREGKSVELVFINNVFDPLEYRDRVERIYSKLPSECLESDVILDFTGMTSCGSVGSVLACLDEKRAIQYTPGYYDATLKATTPLDPVEVVLHLGMLRQPLPSETQRDSNQSALGGARPEYGEPQSKNQSDA